MSQERQRILKMLAKGKITVEEAERLLRAVEQQSDTAAPPLARTGPAGSEPDGRPKYLRVVVTKTGDGEGKAERVNIRVPLSLLRAGMKLGRLIPESARNKANEAMSRHGINLDLNDIGPEKLDEVIAALTELSVEVEKEEGQESVRIFCE